MKKIAVAMSGGVDSSVCAWLLKKQGYDVIGATMRLIPPQGLCAGDAACGACESLNGGRNSGDNGADFPSSGGTGGLGQASEAANTRDPAALAAENAVRDARRVAECIGIPHFVIDLEDEFRKEVVDHFTGSYLKGRTPNPCIMCNPRIKWGAFLARCRELGADTIATGHYARILQLPDGRYTVRNSITAAKDQTYVLYRLTQEQLASTLMPIGEFEKTDIRRMAEEAGLPVAAKKDSQDICFIPDGDYASFIKNYAGTLGCSGHFLDREGKVLGSHAGTAAYTIGQRRGLGVAAGQRVYVCGIDAERGNVYLGKNEDLFSTSLIADEISYMGEARFDEEKVYEARIRYSQKKTACRVRYISEDRILVDFEEPVRAATPGQAVVLYLDDWIAGGGTIMNVKDRTGDSNKTEQ